MPRRPPDTPVGVSRLLFAFLFFSSAPLLSNAQQKHFDPHFTAVAQAKAPLIGTHGHVAHRGPHHPPSPSDVIPKNKDRYTPSDPRNVRALATLAPADAGLIPERAVRAPPATRSAGPTGGLSSRLPARSLQDWEVEDIVLLATVDGTIHARDRRTGSPRWALEADRPMVETTYHERNATVDGDSYPPSDFLWIVEPTQDGSLYGYTPGTRFGMQKLGLTVKQLVEDLSPYAAEDPPVVYTGEKKNTLYTVDIASGKILKVFNAAGSDVIDQGSCRRVADFESLDDEECDAVGTLTLGRTEYTVGVQSSLTGESICTIKYFEWGPNNRDKDLASQYSTTKDNRYVYSMYDGRVLALDHTLSQDHGLEFAQRPTFRQKFISPVVRVFDIARPLERITPDTPMIMLPHPVGPALGEQPSYDDDGKVFVNCTEAGSWYALSEHAYPMVTQGAAPALSSQTDWYQRSTIVDGRPPPLKEALVGVHALSYVEELEPSIPLIAAPGGEVSLPAAAQPPDTQTTPLPDLQPGDALRRSSVYILAIVLAAVVCIAAERYYRRSTVLKQTHLPTLTIQESAPSHTADSHSAAKSEVAAKTVRFDESEVTHDSTDDKPVNELERSVSRESQMATEGATGETITPKKKKAHRGKRGGKKLAEKLALGDQTSSSSKEITDVMDGATDGIKQVGKNVTVIPDSVNLPGPGIPSAPTGLQNLHIRTDKVLGNGSGGTFVFEGEFEGRDVAVKRMLPQYFELASQEVSLLEQSEDHPNVIRYFCRREDQHFLYIALELCQASLWDLFKDGRRDESLDDKHVALADQINSDPRTALRQLAEGVRYLHKFRIVHRDIKPQNMLIAYPKKHNLTSFPRFVISDFGLCKTLPDNVSTLIGTTGNAGTAGWKAPELISKPKDATANSSQHSTNGTEGSASGVPSGTSAGVKRAVDIFSLGCVFFYVLTRGQHPYDDEEGWMALRERNIKADRANFTPLELFGPDTRDLIRWMLAPLPEQRPTASEVLQHPFFWDAEERLEFLSIASDRFDQEARDGTSVVLDELETHVEDIIPKAISNGAYSAAHNNLQPPRSSRGRSGSDSGSGLTGYATKMTLPIPEPNFLAQLDRSFIDTLGKQRRYHPGKLVDLLRALRNKHHHWDDMPENVKRYVGQVPEGYLNYWESKFPALVVGVWRVVKDLGICEERRFWRFYRDKN